MSGATTLRRFGTDVSNIPQQNVFKTPKSKAPIQQSSAKKSRAFPITPKKTEEQEILVEALNKASDDTASVGISSVAPSSPRSNDEFYYDRDFLLKFQNLDYCNQKLEGLIPEVLPGFESVEQAMEQLNINNNNIYKTPNKNDNKRNLSIQIPMLSIKKSPVHTTTDDSDTQNTPSVLVSPLGGVVFKPFKSPREINFNSNTSSSTPLSSKTFSFSVIPPVDGSERAVEMGAGSSDSQASSNVAPPLTLNLEWRVKKLRKQKPREEDPKRLAARQRQIDIGKNTPGYKRFCELVPIDKRTKEHPRVPNIYQVCSKRSWDGQVKKWRRQLHAYDPPELAGEKRDDIEDLIEGDDETEDHADSDEEDSSEDEEIETPTTPTSEVIVH